MKNTTLSYASKCRLYDSIQHVLGPCASSASLTLGPQSAEGDVAVSLVANSAYHLRIFRQAVDLPAYWDGCLSAQQVPMSRSYLQALEQSMADDLGFAYLVFYQHGQAVGVGVCQLMEFQALQHIQALQQPAGGNWGKRAWQALKRALASRIHLKLIVCGAAQITGPYGFAFRASTVPLGEQAKLLAEGIEALAQYLRGQGWRPDGVLFKDFYPEGREAVAPQFRGQGYHPCVFHPNMVLPLRQEWRGFEDYLAAMASKYRVRARRAFKKAAGLHCVELDEAGISQHLPALHQLYREVADSSTFNLLTLSADYFLQLKRACPEDFRLFAYFRDKELIGFFTTLRNGTELEAHFMGFRAAANRQHQLYLNMLFEIVRLAIEEERVGLISFSRTAMEIKSSVGAVPKQAYCYIRHFSPLANRLAPLLVGYLAPHAEDWQQRHPFN